MKDFLNYQCWCLHNEVNVYKPIIFTLYTLYNKFYKEILNVGLECIRIFRSLMIIKFVKNAGKSFLSNLKQTQLEILYNKENWQNKIK